MRYRALVITAAVVGAAAAAGCVPTSYRVKSTSTVPPTLPPPPVSKAGKLEVWGSAYSITSASDEGFRSSIVLPRTWLEGGLAWGITPYGGLRVAVGGGVGEGFDLRSNDLSRPGNPFKLSLGGFGRFPVSDQVTLSFHQDVAYASVPTTQVPTECPEEGSCRTAVIGKQEHLSEDQLVLSTGFGLGWQATEWATLHTGLTLATQVGNPGSSFVDTPYESTVEWSGLYGTLDLGVEFLLTDEVAVIPRLAVNAGTGSLEYGVIAGIMLRVGMPFEVR